MRRLSGEGWSNAQGAGYEVSSGGDRRFSALYARLPDGRILEDAWGQAKGYPDGRSAKGKPALSPDFDYWGTYKGLWRQWADANPQLIDELAAASQGQILVDRFAKTDNNQARALAEILAERQATMPGRPAAGYRAYAGIGSRETPADVMALMQRAAAQLEREGFTLRSGGAQGADSAFEVGASPAMREIYLPWNGFQGKRGGADGYILSERLAAYQLARDLASQFYHSPQRMNERAIGALMSRNSFQIMGQDMESPVEAVLAWTRGGSGSGGTGQALRIAKAKGIPIFDLGNPEVRRVVEQRLEAGEPLFGGVAGQPPAAAAGSTVQGVPFEIVASRGPGASFDVLGMRERGQTMATVSAPFEPGWLGNPFVAVDAGGRLSREEATAAFGELVREKAQDAAWRDAFLSLRGKRIGYYKPEEPAIHLHELQRWIAEQDGDPAVAGVAGVPAGPRRVQLELPLDGGGSPPPPPPPRVTVVAESPEPGPGPGPAPAEEPPLPPREVVENPERKAGDLLPWLLAGGAGGLLGLGAGLYSQQGDGEELRVR